MIDPDDFCEEAFARILEKYQERITQEREKMLLEILAGGSLGDWDSTASANAYQENAASFFGCLRITGA